MIVSRNGELTFEKQFYTQIILNKIEKIFKFNV